MNWLNTWTKKEHDAVVDAKAQRMAEEFRNSFWGMVAKVVFLAVCVSVSGYVGYLFGRESIMYQINTLKKYCDVPITTRIVADYVTGREYVEGRCVHESD